MNKIKSTLNRPAKWTQNCLARDKEGNIMQSLDTTYITKFDKNGEIYYQEFHRMELAHSFSLQGAVSACYNVDEHEGVMQKLSQAISRYTGKNFFVAQFNDNVDTTFKDIEAVVKMAGV